MERTSYYTCVEPTQDKEIRVCVSDMRLPATLKDQMYMITIPQGLSIRQHASYIQTQMGKSTITVCIDGKTNIRIASNDHL